MVPRRWLQPRQWRCTSNAEVLEGVLGALDLHEFVFARLMALADTLGLYEDLFSLSLSSLFDLELTRFGWFPLLLVSFFRVTPKATADGGTGPETQKLLATALSRQRTQTMILLLIPRRCLRRQHHPTKTQTAMSFSRLSRISMRNSQCYTRRSLRERRFSSFRDGDPRNMSVLTARRAQYQASQNQKRGAATTSTAETDDGTPLRWSTTDDRATRGGSCTGEDGTVVRWGQLVVL